MKSYAHQLAHGKRTPSLKLAQELEEKTGYPAGSWKIGESAVTDIQP